MAVKNSSNENQLESVVENRRQSFRKILGAGGLVAGGHLATGTWVTPVVNAVVLPAHAATSPGEVDSLEDPCFVTVSCTDASAEINVQVDGMVVPPIENVMVDIEIAFNESGSFEEFASTSTDSDGTYQETRNFSSEFASSVQIRVTLPEHPDAGTAECSVDTSDESESGALNSSEYYSTSSDDPYFCVTFRDT